MAEEQEPEQSVTSKADALALIEQAEAEAAEAEALAAAARARARAARLRREALALAEAAEDYGDAAAAAADVEAAEDYTEEATEDYDPEHDAAAAENYDEYYGETVADEFEEAPAAESAPEAGEHRGRVPSLSTISKVAAILAICAFVGVSVYMVIQHRDVTQHLRRQAAFVAGAKRGVTYMTSLDFTKAKEDFQRVVDSSTGPFKDDFQRKANDFISVVEQSKAVTEGTVNAAGVESSDGDSAVVLVSATSRITNSPPGKEEPAKIWRLRVTVTDVGGQYKMSKVEYVA